MSPRVQALDVARVQRTGIDPINLMRRRFAGNYELDPWGFDRDVALVAGWASGLRWHTELTGESFIPTDGPALLVANRRLGWSEPLVACAAIQRATGRFVRAAGGGDLDPVTSMVRRFGAIPARPDEVAAALRAGHVVMVPTRREFTRFQAGHLPIDLIEPAVRDGIRVYPVAVSGREAGRRWKVSVGAPLRAPRRGGPRSVGEVAVGVAGELQTLLEAQRGTGWTKRVRSMVPHLTGDAPAQITETGEI